MSCKSSEKLIQKLKYTILIKCGKAKFTRINSRNFGNKICSLKSQTECLDLQEEE